MIKNFLMKPLIRISNITFFNNGHITLSNDVVDASILAGLTFFTNLASNPTMSYERVYQAGIQAGLMFFTFLALKRGLIGKRGDNGGTQ